MPPTQGDIVDVQLGATETTETSVGTITIPSAGISRIVGIYGICSIETPTAGEGTGGYFRLAFKTVAGLFKFPLSIFLGPAGTLADIGVMQEPKIIPVNIPVPPNETVTCYAALFKAQTGTCRAHIGVILE